MTVDEINDEEYQEDVIESAEEGDDGYAVSHGGWTLWCAGKDVVPCVGDTLRMYGKGIGHIVRGIAINGRVVRYESVDDMNARWERESQERDRMKQEEAITKHAESMDRIAALPQVMQDRINGFLRRRADFEWRHLPYELFVCEQAVAFANAFPNNPDGLKTWHGMGYEKQRALVPAMSDDHSGNTFGAAVRLAYFLITDPEDVKQEHGALCPLVGCKEYGCVQAVTP